MRRDNRVVSMFDDNLLERFEKICKSLLVARSLKIYDLVKDFVVKYEEKEKNK